MVRKWQRLSELLRQHKENGMEYELALEFIRQGIWDEQDLWWFVRRKIAEDWDATDLNNRR